MQCSYKRRNRRIRGKVRQELARLKEERYKNFVRKSEPLFKRVRAFKKSVRTLGNLFYKGQKAFARVEKEMRALDLVNLD